MAITAFIPVRGGSRSIPLKNIKLFCGKPLVYWSIKALQETQAVDRIIVATDSKEIEEAVLQFNFSKAKIYPRSKENASDTASTESVMLEYLSQGTNEADGIFILVQATSPLTQSKDIAAALDKFTTAGYDSMLSVVKLKRFLWNADGTAKNYDYHKRPRRQDFEGEFMENGAFYINTIKNILEYKNRLSGKVGLFEMPEFTALEIDEPDDWIIAEQIMYRHILKQRKQNIKLFASDVDGVLTDAGMYYSENGDELKKFNTRDGKGFELLRNAGIKTAIITSENTKIVERRAAKLRVDYLYQGKEYGGKLETIKEICAKENIALNEVAYIGDDINCMDALKAVGLAACPADANEKITVLPGIFTLNKKGGDGAVRELIDMILGGSNQGNA